MNVAQHFRAAERSIGSLADIDPDELPRRSFEAMMIAHALLALAGAVALAPVHGHYQKVYDELIDAALGRPVRS